MAVVDDRLDSWIQDLSGQKSEEESRWSENFIKMVSKDYLQTKIMDVGDSPRCMAVIKDPEGGALVNKYDLLNKQVWQRLRTRPDAPELYFVCEKPIRVVEGYNLEFFNYEDYQFLGAHLAEKGRRKSAGTLFADALKSDTLDAHINKGVYHYRAGETGVLDNYRLAKKSFEKGTSLLHRLDSIPAEKRRRRKVCEDAIYQIGFRCSGPLIRFIKAILRFPTMRFEREIFYVGPADIRSADNRETLGIMTDTIEKYELQMLKDAAESFIYSMKVNVSSGETDLSTALDDLANQMRSAQNETDVAEYAAAMGNIHRRMTASADRRRKAEEDVKRRAEVSLLDKLTTEEEGSIRKLDMAYSLKSPRELADMAERKDLARSVALWLYRERKHFKMIMEALFQNPAVEADIKGEIGEKFGFTSKGRTLY